ncbi:class I SAM-dependent methyltransferase [Syntrophotalea acetylenica]|uniref:class I SAM-dependent methyltransferase n=1 Tax=Syntrophotalea acetylenica TaxID=29542 RepID=UPI000931D020|nr:class I SAM-dependent methyltransferase [Syntrophotalea acetylenica]
MDLKEEDILGDSIVDHWYYVSKGRALRKFLGEIKTPEILDVGAGSGIFSRQLLDAGQCSSAVCVDPNYVNEKTEIYHGKKINFVKSLNSCSHSLVLMMDVLEHVSDDLEFLKSYAKNMKSGGYVLITVPAFNFLWSGHDVFLEHLRRYTINDIETLVKDAGLTPVKSCYFFGSLFPIVVVLRFMNKTLNYFKLAKPQSELRVYPNWLNRLLIIIHNLECYTLFKFNKLFGLTVFSLCRKSY